MPLQNRVTPEGDIVADPARGLFMGNRGCLHDEARRIVRPWKSQLWITCRIAFAGRRRRLMSPGVYTELFFLDEAVALAAGHRPCGECRREDYRRFVACWCAATGGERPSPREMDRALHAARVDGRARRRVTFEADLADLPDGTFVRPGDGGAPLLVLGRRLLPYAPAGYGAPLPRPRDARATVLTPAPTVAVLKAGYAPVLHPSAGA